MYDQPDYSDVSHPSCEDPAEPETCDTCGRLLANQADPAACQCPSCPICGEDHVEAVCPMLVCERCGQHAAWNEIDHDSDICHECIPVCEHCEKQRDDIVRGWCGPCARASRAESFREMRGEV